MLWFLMIKPQTVIRPFHCLFIYCLPSFVFYKASFACFQFVIAHYYSLKAKQNPLFLKSKIQTSPNDRLG